VFRERIFKSFKDDFLNRQPESSRERLNRVISFLSFVSPAPKTDALYNKTAEVLGFNALDVGEDVNALLAAGLVVENREGIRLYPDLFADAILLDACRDQKGRPSLLHQAVLSKLAISDFPALMRNVAQADWEARPETGEEGPLFEPVWKEFVRRFQEGVWVLNWEFAKKWLIESYLEGGPRDRRPDRAELLSQWASFAVYLPEKTLELAKLVIESARAAPSPGSSTSESGREIRSSVSATLPPLLKPIVTWHSQYADQALEILWSLDAEEPKSDWQKSSNAVGVVADAASFEFQKPLQTSATIMGWIEKKLRDETAVERLRQQPWILSALLKPFFGRAVDHNWVTGNTAHFSSIPVDVDRTRPLRQRALSIFQSFLRGEDTVLCNAVVPLIEEAIRSRMGSFGASMSESDHEIWRPDRLEVLKMVEEAAQTHRDFPPLLLQFRRILRGRYEYDPDPLLREECRRVLLEMPDTFELRVARALTSLAHDEIKPKLGPTFKADLEAAETKWEEFRRSVAGEIIDRFKTAKEACEFLSRWVRELSALKHAVLGGNLLEPIARISPAWCVSLVEEMLTRHDPTLDEFLWPVLGEAARNAPEAYQNAIRSLPVDGRPQQLSALVSFLGWKHLHGGGLTQLERECVLASTHRTEEAVVTQIASTAGIFFDNDPCWAIEVLNQLKPSGEHGAYQIVQALGHLVEKYAALLDQNKVAQCLSKLGELLFSERLSDDHSLCEVARAFPKEVYECVLSLYKRLEAGPAEKHGWGLAERLSLGPIGDDVYVDREIQTLWQVAVSSDSGSFSQHFRLGLIRSLLWADGPAAPNRLQRLVAACASGEELKLVAKIVATRGSRFVFTFPDIVRPLLTLSEEFGVADEVREALWLSACGGARGYTEHELDPEYRYILEQGEALANRYRDDPRLERFYRMVAESERHQNEWRKRAFRDVDDLE
jgi:hypothetical protein